jgi:hypothetical protein
MPQPTSSEDSPSATAKDSPSKLSDEWSEVKDPNERRKIQNKLAQRRFRKCMIEDTTVESETDYIQGTKSRSKRKRTIANLRIDGEQAAPMCPQNLKISRRAKIFQVFHGAGSL